MHFNFQIDPTTILLIYFVTFNLIIDQLWWVLNMPFNKELFEVIEW